jgi:hypothetical protein
VISHVTFCRNSWDTLIYICARKPINSTAYLFFHWHTTKTYIKGVFKSINMRETFLISIFITSSCRRLQYWNRGVVWDHLYFLCHIHEQNFSLISLANEILMNTKYLYIVELKRWCFWSQWLKSHTYSNYTLTGWINRYHKAQLMKLNALSRTVCYYSRQSS